MWRAVTVTGRYAALRVTRDWLIERNGTVLENGFYSTFPEITVAFFLCFLLSLAHLLRWLRTDSVQVMTTIIVICEQAQMSTQHGPSCEEKKEKERGSFMPRVTQWPSPASHHNITTTTTRSYMINVHHDQQLDWNHWIQYSRLPST